MLNTIYNKGSIPVLEQILFFTAERHKIIANNIANVDTPGYIPKDLPVDEFKSQLLEAIERANQREVPVLQFEGVDGARVQPGGGLEIEYVERPTSSYMKHDRNAVDIDLEMAELVKNAQLHNAVASILQQQLNLLREAISERISG